MCSTSSKQASNLLGRTSGGPHSPRVDSASFFAKMGESDLPISLLAELATSEGAFGEEFKT
jgi:hypothetical protein